MIRFAQHRTFSGPLYIVTRDFGSIGMESVTSPGDTRNTIAADIASGQIDRVVSVIEVMDGMARDITEEIERVVSIAHRDAQLIAAE